MKPNKPALTGSQRTVGWLMIGTVIVGNATVLFGIFALTSPSLKPYKVLITSLVTSVSMFLSGFTVGHLLTLAWRDPPGDKQ